ncbi:MAG: ABC transporter transmembrane domain-containing protein [Phycisphaerales bacterium]
MVALPIQFIVIWHYGRSTKPKFKVQAELVDGLIHKLQEAIAGIRVIRAFGRAREQTAGFDEAAAEARDQRIRLSKSVGTHIPMIQAGGMLTAAVLLGVGGWLVLQNQQAAEAAAASGGVRQRCRHHARRSGSSEACCSSSRAKSRPLSLSSLRPPRPSPALTGSSASSTRRSASISLRAGRRGATEGRDHIRERRFRVPRRATGA